MNKKIIGFITLLFIILAIWQIQKIYFLKANRSFREKYKIKYDENKIYILESDLNIIHLDFLWKEPLIMENSPVVIIYHHTAISEISAEEIDLLHKSKGWKGIGYHYFIRKNGEIYSGRPEIAEGAHAYNNNFTSIGIAVEGNFEEEYLTKEQVKSLIKLSEYLCIKYDIKDILGHKDVGNTLCPGKNFPVDEMKKNIIKDLKEIRKT